MNIYDLQLSFGTEVPDQISLNIYFSGCLNNKKCERCLCQNKDLHDFSVGNDYLKYIPIIKNILNENFVDCICYLGGEPLDQKEDTLLILTNMIQEIKSDIDIYAYTGYDYDDNKEKIDHCISIFKIKDIYVGHYSSENNSQYWLSSKK